MRSPETRFLQSPGKSSIFLGAASTVSARSSAASTADTTLSEHLNPNPQRFLLFLSYFREPYKGSFLLHSSHGCANLGTAQFCWHTCCIPCCSVLASCRSGNARFDLYLVQLLQVSVATFSEERIFLNPVLVVEEEVALLSHKEREFRHCWFWQGGHSGCLYIRTRR